MQAFLKANQERRAIKTAMGHARHWRRLLPDRIVQNLKPADVQGYIVQRKAEGASNSTINREMATLRAALNWCSKALGWCLPNPVRGRFLQEPEGRMRWLSFAEADRPVSMARKSAQATYLADFLSLALNV